MSKTALPESSDGLRAVDLPAVSAIRDVTDEDVARAVELMRERLSRLSEIDGVVRVDFGTNRSIYVDRKRGAFVDPTTAVGRLLAHPDDIRRIIEGLLDPRSAMLFSTLKVGGDVPTIRRFCDRLAGVRSQTYMEGRPEFPKATTDWKQARLDLQKFGYCLIKNALTADQVKALKDRLVEQAAAEEEAGVAWWEGHAGHWRN